jgi:carboxyl-terminal processing protease
VQAAVLLLVVSLIGVGSFTLGYKKGAAELATPIPTLIHTDSSGDPSMVVSDSSQNVDFGDFWKAWNILNKNFSPTSTSTPVNGTTTEQMRVMFAIDGLVRSYEDPYTVFIPKAAADNFKEQVNAEFEGIGAALSDESGQVLVTAILPNSPAEGSGLAAKDRIMAVDGNAVTGVPLTDIISHIRGAKGTTVKLTVLKAKTKKETDITITRGTVAIPTTATRVVSAAKSVIAAAAQKAAAAAAAIPGTEAQKEAREAEAAKAAANQKFFVLQLTTFAKSSTDAFVADLGKFAKSDTKNLIIDLRNNPGGYIETADDLASYFVPKDAIVVSERQGANNVIREHRSYGYGLLSDATSSRRIVVLVNRNSASASEILAGALQDYKIAKVVGEQSFGKGSVQTLIDLGTIGTLKVTVARWYTPGGRNISHQGITPDVVVDLKDTKYASSTDPFMDAAVETLLDDAQWK